MTKVQIAGRAHDLDSVVSLMDDTIRENMHERGWEFADEQAFVDAYCHKHARCFGQPFVVN